MGVKVRSQLAVLRAKKGQLSQTELSKRTGITQKQLSALERGKTKGIEFGTLGKLCEFFDCTPNDLLAIEVEPEPRQMSRADEIIAQGLNRAMAAPKQSAEAIWAEFDAVREKMGAAKAKPKPIK